MFNDNKLRLFYYNVIFLERCPNDGYVSVDATRVGHWKQFGHSECGVRYVLYQGEINKQWRPQFILLYNYLSSSNKKLQLY